MVKIILAIFILGVIVALHEFGHFIVAKLCGIRVNQFAIGMGPAILKKQWGETEYSQNENCKDDLYHNTPFSM